MARNNLRRSGQGAAVSIQLGTIDFLATQLLPHVKRRGSVVSLSRVSIFSPPAAVKRYLEASGFHAWLDRVQWEGHRGRLTTRDLFLAFGFERYDDIDIDAEEGCTITHDLNRPVPAELHGRYDLVLEMGTLEHIFDIRAVFESVIRMLKVGGVAFHFSPVDWFNHGFYNFSFTLFNDVYRVNGFDDMAFYIVAFPTQWETNQEIKFKQVDFTPQQMLLPPPPDKHLYMVSCIARKARELPSFQVPIQAVYDPALRLNTALRPRGGPPPQAAP